MKHLLLLVFIIFPGISLMAQELVESDSVEVKPPLNVHFSPYVQWNEVFQRQMAYGGGEVEMVYNDRFVFGFFGEVMFGTFLSRIVFPNIYEFENYKYGVTAGYNYMLSDKFRISSRVKLSRQVVQWQEQEGGSYRISDVCSEIRPQVGLSYFPIEHLVVSGAVGYNVTNGLDLSGIQQQDMTGLALTLSIGIKF